MSHLVASRELRQRATKAERALWQLLRAKKTGMKWRRQHVMGPYILDFYCASRRLSVELDGLSHESVAAQDYDTRRSAWLASIGVRELRFPNAAVLADPRVVVEQILAGAPHLASPKRGRKSHPSSPGGGG